MFDNLPFRRAASCIFAFAAAALASVPPSTGANQSNGRDLAYRITSDTTGQLTSPGGAFIVTSVLADGWAGSGAFPGTGALWVAPSPDQSNASRNGKFFNTGTTYQLQFTVFDIDLANLVMTLAADDNVTVTLVNPSGSKNLYTSPGAIYRTPVTFQLDKSKGLADGPNTLLFAVSNSGGGPTGLNVSFAGTLGDGNVTGKSSKVARYTLSALVDPVDGATGQFYDSVNDFALGGPLQFGFWRYYSSALSQTGVASALGINWMSNFDECLNVAGDSAKLLLFGGSVVDFKKQGGRWAMAAPGDTVYQLVEKQTTFRLMDPTTRWIHTFDTDSGALLKIEDRNGNAITVAPGPFGPVSAKDGFGRTLTFTYTGGRLSKVTDQAGRTVTYAYNGNLLLSAVDIYKQTTKYTYDNSGVRVGLLTKTQLPLGNVPTTQTYDGSGRVISQTDANNNTTKVAYDGNGGTTITGPLGNVTRQASDTNGNGARLADPQGGVTSQGFDGSSRRISVTDALGRRTDFVYDAISGYPTSISDALGNTTIYTYSSQIQDDFTFYNLIAVKYPDDGRRTMTYDSKGNLLSVTSPRGGTVKYTYDARGLVTSSTGATGNATVFAWNDDATLASAKDPLGNLTTYAYDSLKRVTRITDPNGGRSGFIYDQSTTGPMNVFSHPGGGSRTLYTDQNRQLQDQGNGAGAGVHYEYTGTGQLASVTDPLKNKTTYAYDAADRVRSITNGAGETVTYGYDSANNVASESDANGPVAAYTYAAEGFVASATDGSKRTTTYGYDPVGRLSTITTAAGNKYSRAYDKMGRVTSLTNPLGEAQSVTWNADGQIASWTVPGSLTTTLTRDDAGHVTALSDPAGNTWNLSYDTAGRTIKRTDPLGRSVTGTYTGTLLTGLTLPLGSVAITNDLNGRATKREFSDGTTVNAAYDANGLLTEASGLSIKRERSGQVSTINGIDIAYDAVGRPASYTYGPGKIIAYGYDKGGRLASVKDWIGGATTFAYDGAGRITSVTYPNGVVTSYGYDAEGRLVKIAAGELAAVALTRDAAGKILSAERTGLQTPAVRESSQQVSYDAAGQSASATSDDMGRVLGQNGRNFIWNLASRMTSFSDGANTATFAYDAFGHISSTNFSGTQQDFVYNYSTSLPSLSIVRQASADARYYVYLPNGLLLYGIDAASGERRFYHFDEMGNTMLLTGENGSATDTYSITPYGDVDTHYGTSDNPFTWQGQYGVIREGTGLYYLRARHYDAASARFLSPDPVPSADPRAMGPYTYANGNPLFYIDPLGTQIALPGPSPLTNHYKAKKYADDLAHFIGEYMFNVLGENLTQKQFEYFSDFVQAVQDYPYLDWASYAQFAPFNGVRPPPPPQNDPPPPVQTPPSHPKLVPSSSCSQTGTCGSGAATALPPPGALRDTPGIIFPGGSYRPGGLVIISGKAFVVSNDGGTLISQDGSNLVPGTWFVVNGRAFVVSNDGGTLISQDGSNIVSHDGGSLVSHDVGSIVSQGGGNILGSIGNLIANFFGK
ncbi:MAG: RHS repeat-associated core domain-containing protein [Bryobacteraceae bacterium]